MAMEETSYMNVVYVKEERRLELEETFPCDICKVSFITRQERNKHIESHFTRHECQHCSKSLILIGNHFYELHSTVNCIRTFDGHLENLAYDESKCITEKSILRESKGLENDSINNILKNETRNSARISLQIGTTQDDQGFSTDVEGVTEAQEVERKRKKRTKRKATKRRKQILEKSLESNDSFEAKQDECQVSAKDLANDSSAAINLGEDTANDVEDDSGEEAHSPPGYVTSNVPAGFANKVFNMYKPINKRLQSKIPCDECNKLFRTNRTLMSHKKNIHQRNTSANRTASCDECGRAFSNVGNLNKHKLIHQDTKRFICSYCGKGFNGYFNLTEHMNIHTGLKPYPCQVCSKTFGRATHLVVHMRVHTGEKPFKCDMDNCDRAYAHTIDLKRHKYSVHGIYTKKHECPICGKIYSENKLLKKHLESHRDKVQ